VAICGQGTRLNGMILQPLQPANLTDGSLGVGFSNRVTTVGVNTVVSSILDAGGVFHRNASGALSLADTTSPKSWLTLGFPIPKKSESVCALSMEE
jgi:hypothetical protein